MLDETTPKGRLLSAALACARTPTADASAAGGPTGGDWLYAWSASADSARPAAFLAAFDLREASPTAGRLVRVVSTGPGAQGTHHSEHALASDRLLFANDFGAGRSFVFDLNDPANPRIKASFACPDAYKDKDWYKDDLWLGGAWKAMFHQETVIPDAK